MVTSIVYNGEKESVIVAYPKPKKLFERGIPVKVSDIQAEVYKILPGFEVVDPRPGKKYTKKETIEEEEE